jgi:glycosyltransferase involved in cell wall biosynthesis
MTIYGDKENAMFVEWTERALRQADHVIALSENTRRDVENAGVAPSRVRVIYGGGRVIPEEKIQYQRMGELKSRLSLPDKYILFVGTLQPRKNVPFLVRSFAKLKETTNIPHKLVLVGHRDSAAVEVENLARTLGIAEDVLITGYVAEWELPLLYKHSDVFVLPTLYEGFTLVTLEAMTYGIPVVATDTSSIREGVGEAALLVQSNDVEELASAIASVLLDQPVRARLIERGKKQAQKFTWERCARETLELYQEVYQHSNSPMLVS